MRIDKAQLESEIKGIIARAQPGYPLTNKQIEVILVTKGYTDIDLGELHRIASDNRSSGNLCGFRQDGIDYLLIGDNNG